MKRFALILICLFAIGDKVYLLSPNRHIGISEHPSTVSDIYTNKDGKCVYKVQIYGRLGWSNAGLLFENEIHLWDNQSSKLHKTKY